MKDLFSDQSKLYQQARPVYPQAVILEILKHTHGRHTAWDCGAGSGQFTQLLASYFDQVIATDLSESQLKQAPPFENVEYQVVNAEQTGFPNHGFDLITVAQAIHWFDFDKFYQEVNRTLKPNGLLAVVGYGLLGTDHVGVNDLIRYIYVDILGKYWDVERRYVDEAYQTIPFPFEEIKTTRSLEMNFQWGINQLVDYLSTWSALKHYKKDQNSQNEKKYQNEQKVGLNQNKPQDPLKLIIEYCQINNITQLAIRFPIYLRLGRSRKSS